MQQDDVISAIATAPGEGGIGIIRISGNGAVDIANKIFRPYSGNSLKECTPRLANYGKVVDENGKIIDEAICIVMYAPNSYTCEDVAEIQCHGGNIVMREILLLTYRMGARAAEPGEFTKRAFLNGRIDLSQAQAVMDIINAKTKASLDMAMDHLSGRFSDTIKVFRNDLLSIIAHLEASIDFPEDDIEEFDFEDTKEKIKLLLEKIEKMLDMADTGIILRDGLKTAIIGKPNAGKSSIMNFLLGQERAIVTEVPGTTRDSIEEYVNIGGIPLRLIDTAGIRSTDDIVEKIGVEKAYSYAYDAELVLAVFDSNREMTAEDEEIIKLIDNCSGNIIIIMNKIDLSADLNNDILINKLESCKHAKICGIVPMSAKKGQGQDKLEKLLSDIVYGGNVKIMEHQALCDARQSEILRQTAEFLKDSINTINIGMSEDFIVIDLRSAWEKLGEITGESLDEDILNQIFSKFCIGK
ncbi:MAG: tRNA uridine-5-carboxymethylaminomethyl(34) synthesis GTPase MnmE [Anaerovibrio sp.]|uniref:tRNA uridine-5-carboxymethylaminomethyl(34) synthesis GTPase MnmE n=1 Tax=Anaerovibrio sp. TaxID=1872532 RepID=UPI0025D150EE|nr:tRNA uridine-5-carboxymethylaminomethyl(34) synthesis GTPase MnmE [Anaerovibrio sp.]MCR5176080.1 tRNA uridine-5-carboxymethylaminomethyl(34) synthesis GTPase MnmE [Anaerovibrio sp.]